ncbi:MAG: DUF1566 domain-containing protein [Casimicrobiaceae bacterium]
MDDLFQGETMSAWTMEGVLGCRENSTTRLWRALLVVVLGGVVAMAGTPVHAGEFAYVASYEFYQDPNANVVSVIDTSTRTIVKKILVPAWPLFFAVNPKLQVLYLSIYRGSPGQPGTVVVINALTNEVLTLIGGLGRNPSKMVLNASGTLLYVQCDDHTIRVVDTANNTVIATLPGGGSLALNPANTVIYETYGLNGGNPGYVSVINAATGAVVGGPITVGIFPADVAVDPTSTYAFVVNQGSGTVSVIATASNAVVNTIQITVGDPVNDDSTQPQQIVFNKTGTFAYVKTRGYLNGQVAVIDMSTFGVVGRIQVGPTPNDISLDPAGAFLYVTTNDNQGNGKVSVIDTATRAIVAAIPVPHVAAGVTVFPLPPPTAFCPPGNLRSKPDALYSINSGAQVITDTLTGLMWKQCSEGQSGAACATGAANAMTWGAALSAAAGSNFAGYGDWRLPNEKELETLYETGCLSPSINRNVFPATQSSRYWTSTTYTYSTDQAWDIDFSTGLNVNYPDYKSVPHYVRLVRGGQPLDTFDKTASHAPNAFSFAAQTGVPLASTITSNAITLSGLGTPTGIRIAGGINARYSVNGGAFTAVPGTVVNGNTVRVQQTSSASLSTMTTVTLTVGGVTGGFSATTTAAAPAQRTFVSATGNDTNTCTAFAPCRSFAVAIARANPGGEVLVLDSAGYGPVAISQPVSIIAMPGIYAGISVTSGTGITINAGAGRVVLRGLAINGLGGSTGIDFQSGAALYLDRVVISGFSATGLLAGSGEIFIHDSSFRDNFNALNISSPSAVQMTKAHVERSQFERNVYGLSVSGAGAVATVDHTTMAGGTWGIYQQPTAGGGTSSIVVRYSSITGNATSGLLVGGITGTTSTLSLQSSHVSDNGKGVDVQAGAIAYVSDTTVTRNSSGISILSGTVVSLGDNRITGNTVDGSFSSTVSKL